MDEQEARTGKKTGLEVLRSTTEKAKCLATIGTGIIPTEQGNY
jgi:hypothetical protein